jgi:hypothetical protein
MDGIGNGYGFGFFQSDDAIAQSDVFKEAIEKAIEAAKGTTLEAKGSLTAPDSQSSVTERSNDEPMIGPTSVSESAAVPRRIDLVTSPVKHHERHLSASPSLHSTYVETRLEQIVSLTHTSFQQQDDATRETDGNPARKACDSKSKYVLKIFSVIYRLLKH